MGQEALVILSYFNSVGLSPLGLERGCPYAGVAGEGEKIQTRSASGSTSLEDTSDFCLCFSVDLWKDEPWNVFDV